MSEMNRMISRRKFLKSTALASAALTAGLSSTRAATGVVNIRYFCRAPWPSSETYANWLIDEWNKKNGDRIQVTGASVDGETYKTKQTIEISSSNPPDVFYSWEGGRAARIDQERFRRRSDALLQEIRLGQVAQSGQRVARDVRRQAVFRSDRDRRLGRLVSQRSARQARLSVPTTWDEMMANAPRPRRPASRLSCCPTRRNGRRSSCGRR